MIHDIISDIVKKRRQSQEEIVKQAFLAHFGFQLEEAHYPDLSRVIKAGSSVQRFCYKDECFLLWDESGGLNVENGVDFWRGTLTVEYMFV